jgi:hypothetical protein
MAKEVIIIATYIIITPDLTECLSGGFPVSMAGDLNAKYTDWNPRLTTARGSLLRVTPAEIPA